MAAELSPDRTLQPLRTRVFSGVRWAAGSQIFQQVLNLGASFALTRLLTPEDFGLIAMTCVFTGIVYFVLDLGISSAIIQRPELSDIETSSAFWMNVAVGSLMLLAGVALSGPIADLYRSPQVQGLVAVMACNFLISSLGTTQGALLIRKMRFRELEFNTLAGELASIAVAITLAVYGWGVWSLVARIITSTALRTAMLWVMSDWHPRWSFSWPAARRLLSFGSDVLAINMLGHLGRNGDNFLIGRFLGATQLGYYNLAYNLMSLPVQRLGRILARVLFPALASVQDDPARLLSAWLRANRLIAAVMAPLLLGMSLLAPQLVEIVYGERWLPSVPVVQVLAACGILQALEVINGTALLALGRSRLSLRLIALSTGFLILAFVVSLQFGILGMAIGYAVATVASFSFNTAQTLRCLGSDTRAFFENLSGVLVAVLIMGAAVAAFSWLVPWGAPAKLALAVPVGALVYLTVLRLQTPALVNEMLNILPERARCRLQWLHT